MRHPFSKLVAALCLWMGTGGVLHHTEDLAGLASLAVPVSVGHVSSAVPSDDCAACEWTQGLQTGTPITFRVVPPLDALTLLVVRLPQRFPAAISRHRSPRAPPCSSA